MIGKALFVFGVVMLALGVTSVFAPGTVVKMRATTLDLTNSGVGIGTTSTTILSVDKPISEVKVGDYVLNKDGTQENEVVFIEKHEKKETTLYSPTPDVKSFATKNHMLYKDGEWVVIDDFYPWLRELKRYQLMKVKVLIKI